MSRGKLEAVINTHPKISLMEADLVVDTLETISVDDLARLFGKEPLQYKVVL